MKTLVGLVCMLVSQILYLNKTVNENVLLMGTSFALGFMISDFIDTIPELFKNNKN